MRRNITNATSFPCFNCSAVRLCEHFLSPFFFLSAALQLRFIQHPFRTSSGHQRTYLRAATAACNVPNYQHAQFNRKDSRLRRRLKGDENDNERSMSGFWFPLGYRSREAAAGTTMREEYDLYSKEAEKLSKYLKAIRLRQALQEFHTNAHVEEIDRQLQGIKPADIIAPPSVRYDLPERAHVAQSYAVAADMTDTDQLHELRLELIGRVSRLYGHRESRTVRQKKRKLVGDDHASPSASIGDD